MFTRYNVSPIAIALVLVYAASFILYKAGKIRVATHRKIWNVLLLLTFLVTGIFGLILAIRRDYVLMFDVPFNLLFWHVEAGVVMTIISIFHLSWHLKYYRDLFKRRRTLLKEAEEGECERQTGEQRSP